MCFLFVSVLLQRSWPGPGTEEPDCYICRHIAGISHLVFSHQKVSLQFACVTLWYWICTQVSIWGFYMLAFFFSSRVMASLWTDSSTCCLRLETSTMKRCWRSGCWCSGNNTAFLLFPEEKMSKEQNIWIVIGNHASLNKADTRLTHGTFIWKG